MRKQHLLLCVMLLFAGGCATLSEEQCLDLRNSSWEFVGQQDGRDGRDPENMLTQHRDACRKVGVIPDRPSYLAGWHRGIPSYCTSENGFYLGQNGYSENSYLCPPESRNAFLMSYNHGRDIYEMRREIERLQDEMEEIQDRLEREENMDRRTRRDLHDRLRHRDYELSRLYHRMHAAEDYGPKPW